MTGVAELRPKARRRLIFVGLARAFAVMTALIVLYYALPLDRGTAIPFWLSLSLALLLLGAVTAYQVRAIIRARHPGVRAIEAAAVTVPLFILLFAASYFLLSATDVANFDVGPLSRTDALYFTVTVFATVGFGDITATSQFARVLVTVQMILDLIVLGAVVRVFIGAVQFARQSTAGQNSTAQNQTAQNPAPDVVPAPADRDGGDSAP